MGCRQFLWCIGDHPATVDACKQREQLGLVPRYQVLHLVKLAAKNIGQWEDLYQRCQRYVLYYSHDPCPGLSANEYGGYVRLVHECADACQELEQVNSFLLVREYSS